MYRIEETHVDLATGEIRIPDEPGGARFAREFAREVAGDVATFWRRRLDTFGEVPSGCYASDFLAPIVTDPNGRSTGWQFTYDDTIKRIARDGAPEVAYPPMDEPFGGENDAGEPRASRMHPLFVIGVRDFRMPLVAVTQGEAERYAVDLAYALPGVDVALYEGTRLLFQVTAPDTARSAADAAAALRRVTERARAAREWPAPGGPDYDPIGCE